MGMGEAENSEKLASWRIAIINLIRLELPYISKEEEPAIKESAPLVTSDDPVAFLAEKVSPINVMV